MKTFSSQIDKRRFIEDLKYLHKGATDDLLNELAAKIDAGNGYIVSFLHAVDSIDDAKVCKYCRMAAIAQMYNAGLDYRSGHPYVESSGNVILLQFKDSTAIVSKYGEILFDEGEIWTHSGLNYGFGFVTRKVEDDKISNKYGFISQSGALVLPFIFSGFDNHIMECNPIFEGQMFDFRLYGKVDNIENAELEWIIEGIEEQNVCCCLTKNSLCFTLRAEMPCDFFDTDRDRDDILKMEEGLCETTKKLKALVSDIVVAKEQLQAILEARQ